MLSDYLGIPNLRQRAFAYLGSHLRRLWRRTLEIPSVCLRERRVFLLYGVLAGVYSYWLLGSIALAFGQYLVDRYHGAGVVLFSALLMVPFQDRIKRLRARVAGAAGLLVSGRMMRSRATAVGATLLVLGTLWFGRMELAVSGEFRVLPLHNADVRAEVEGLIERIYVDEGSRVKEGDLIATLSDGNVRAELEETAADIQEKQAQLKGLLRRVRPEEVALARSLAENDLERSRSLLRDGLISRQQFEQAQVDREVRRHELEEARAELSALRSDDLLEIRGELAVAQREAGQAQAQRTGRPAREQG